MNTVPRLAASAVHFKAPLIAIVLAMMLCVRGAAHDGPNAPLLPGHRVLVFSAVGYYRHPDLPAMNGWLVRLCAEHGIQVDVTETPGDLTDARLAGYEVLVLNSANELTKVLNEKQRGAVEAWYRKGGGLVGLHAALVHQTEWTWFAELAGCDFNSDSEFLKARVTVDPAAKDHATVKGQPAEFWYEADWSNHTRPVSGLEGVRVLLRVEESTYEPVRDYFKTRGGKPMGADHPIAWTREWQGSRFFYTELGHDLRSVETPFGRQHVWEGIRWAAGSKWDGVGARK
jgi:uncharacterized protein